MSLYVRCQKWAHSLIGSYRGYEVIIWTYKLASGMYVPDSAVSAVSTAQRGELRIVDDQRKHCVFWLIH